LTPSHLLILWKCRILYSLSRSPFFEEFGSDCNEGRERGGAPTTQLLKEKDKQVFYDGEPTVRNYFAIGFQRQKTKVTFL
jgi:hypothetical protein